MSLLTYLNPFAVFRDFFRRPVETFVYRQFEGYKKKTDEGLNNAKELVYKAAIISVFLSAILWMSIFLYVIFYYTYMPNVTHVRPVHLQFKSCDEQVGICSFPSAHVQLTKRSSMLMSAQPYRVKLVLDMPESQINKDLGMFMVCAQMRAKGGKLVSSSCRSAMLRYRSRLHEFMRTILLAPLFLSSVDEEKQQLQVELFSDFEDDQVKLVITLTAVLKLKGGQMTFGHFSFYNAVQLDVPVTDAYVEVQSRYVQVYSCELHIQAHFTGLRYMMFNWPKISALFGISTNLFFVSLVFILSWYHLQDGLPDFIKSKFRSNIKIEDDDKKLVSKIELEREDSSTFFEGDTLLEEFRQIEEAQKGKKT